MLGRIRASAAAKRAETEESELPSPANASALIGGSGVSLDGQSLILPSDAEGDDISSINTSTYGGGGGVIKTEMRILGTMDHDEEIPPSPESMDPRQEALRLQRMRAENARRHNYERKTYPAGSGDAGYRREDKHQQKQSQNQHKSMDDATETSESAGGCLPLWLTDAPMWLKLVIVLSTALLVGAIVLIGVGAALAVKEESANTGTGGGAFIPPPVAPIAPTDAPIPMTNPPVPPGYPTLPPIPAPTRPPITPTAPSPDGSTGIPTYSATPGETVTFFATGGRFTGDDRAALPDQLTTLPNFDGATVMFHLGDWNSPFATSCNELSYQENTALFANSGVPVYFVPGDNEYNDCPNPEQAFGFWYEYNLEFETKFWQEPKHWNVTRQEPDYPENFYYVYNGILFIGINLVGGVIHDSREWQNRHAANLQWIDDLYNQYQPTGEINAMVILAHADPDIQANGGFFDIFLSRVQNDYDMLTFFIHRNLGIENWGIEPQFRGIDNLIVVVVEGSVWPPMMIQIDPQTGIVDINQDEWYQSYLNGTLTL